MLDFEELSNGNLKIKADKEAKKELSALDHPVDRENLIREWHYEPPYIFKTADEFGGNLSEAPCFLEDSDTDQNDNQVDVHFWFYGNYMIKDFTEILINNGEVIFTAISPRETKAETAFSVAPELSSILAAYRQMKTEEKTDKQKAKDPKHVLSAEDKDGKAHKRAYGKNVSQCPQDAEN